MCVVKVLIKGLRAQPSYVGFKTDLLFHSKVSELFHVHMAFNLHRKTAVSFFFGRRWGGVYAWFLRKMRQN